MLVLGVYRCCLYCTADAGLPRSLPRDVMGIGLSTGVLLDEFSWLPRSASGKVTANLFGYDMELFEVSVECRSLHAVGI